MLLYDTDCLVRIYRHTCCISASGDVTLPSLAMRPPCRGGNTQSRPRRPRPISPIERPAPNITPHFPQLFSIAPSIPHPRTRIPGVCGVGIIASLSGKGGDKTGREGCVAWEFAKIPLFGAPSARQFADDRPPSPRRDARPPPCRPPGPDNLAMVPPGPPTFSLINPATCPRSGLPGLPIGGRGSWKCNCCTARSWGKGRDAGGEGCCVVPGCLAGSWEVPASGLGQT